MNVCLTLNFGVAETDLAFARNSQKDLTAPYLQFTRGFSQSHPFLTSFTGGEAVSLQKTTACSLLSYSLAFIVQKIANVHQGFLVSDDSFYVGCQLLNILIRCCEADVVVWQMLLCGRCCCGRC